MLYTGLKFASLFNTSPILCYSISLGSCQQLLTIEFRDASSGLVSHSFGSQFLTNNYIANYISACSCSPNYHANYIIANDFETNMSLFRNFIKVKKSDYLVSSGCFPPQYNKLYIIKLFGSGCFLTNHRFFIPPLLSPPYVP